MTTRGGDARILTDREYESLIDKFPSLRDRIALHQHDALRRQRIKELETRPAEGGPSLHEIIGLIRSHADGRETTVRGKTILKLADELEATYEAA